MLDSTTADGVEPSSPLSRLTGRIGRGVDYLAGILALYPYVFLGLASLGYFAVTCYRAQRRLFWFDEIFTFYIARLPDLASMWSACMHGADFNPPLLYFLTRWSQGLFGVTELGTRMPQVIGFWVFCLCLYRFVSIRANALAGFIALLFPLTTGAYWYAYDARSHGLVLGFFGLALISWQGAASPGPRHWAALAGLAASLNCAALCHCYAFLLFIPLGVGELTRTILRRRFDLAVWGALALAAIVSLVTVFPLLHTVRGSFAPGMLPSPFRQFWSGWDLSVQPPRFTLALLLLLSAREILPPTSRFNDHPRNPEGAGSTFAWHEIAMLAGILCTPFFAFVCSLFAHAPLYGRYSLIVTAGFACLIGAALARSYTSGLLALSMTILLIAADSVRFYRGSFVNEPSTFVEVETRPAPESFQFEWIGGAAQGSDPIVLLDYVAFAPMFYYAPPSIRSRLVYLIPDFNGEGYLRLQRCCGAPGRISSRPEFLAAHRAVFVYGTEGRVSCETARLGRLDGQITVQARNSGHCLFRIEFPATQPGMAATP